MLEFLLIIHLIIVAYVLLDILGSGATPLAKIGWPSFILALPVVGVVVWMMIGPRAPAGYIA